MSDVIYSYAVTVSREEGRWQVREFPDDFSSVKTSINAVRALRAEGAAFAMLCVDDAYFVVVRPVPDGERIFMSDAAYAIEDLFAKKWVDYAGIQPPDLTLDDEEIDDVWPDGDFEIFADLGLSAERLGYLCDNKNEWPSDCLLRIAGELGFADELEEMMENLD